MSHLLKTLDAFDDDGGFDDEEFYYEDDEDQIRSSTEIQYMYDQKKSSDVSLIDLQSNVEKKWIEKNSKVKVIKEKPIQLGEREKEKD